MSAPIAIGLGIIFSLLIKPDNKFITRRVSTIPLQIGVVILGLTIGINSALHVGNNYFGWITLFVFLSFFGGLVYLKNSYFYYCSSDSETTHSLLTDFSNSRPLTKLIPVELSNIYIQDDLRLLIIDSDAPFDLPDFDPNYILLRANPKVNIERLLNRYKPAKLIADGSNGPWNLAL